MNKKLSIFAIILVIIGAIGAIYYSFKTVPFVLDRVYEIKNEVDKEQIIYNEELDINKLNIGMEHTNVSIKKHSESSVKIVKTGLDKENNYTIENNNKELILKEKEINNNFDYNYKINNLDDLIRLFTSEIYENDKMITVYVPNNVDLDVSTKYDSLYIHDNVLLNSVSFKTIYGNLSLPSEVKNLKTLNVVSKENIQLSMGELLGIENVNIVCNSATIYSNDDDIFIEDIEKYIPNNVVMDIDSSKSNYNGSINIATDIPVANNLNINAQKSQVSLQVPSDKFKFNVDLRALDNINTNYSQNNGDSVNNITREIRGALNNNLDTLEQEYKMSIKAQEIYID